MACLYTNLRGIVKHVRSLRSGMHVNASPIVRSLCRYEVRCSSVFLFPFLVPMAPVVTRRDKSLLSPEIFCKLSPADLVLRGSGMVVVVIPKCCRVTIMFGIDICGRVSFSFSFCFFFHDSLDLELF